MANYLVTDTDLTSVADAIRTKRGTASQLSFPTGFISAIQGIPSGDWQDISASLNLSQLQGTADIRFAIYNANQNLVFIYGDIEEESRYILEITDSDYYPSGQPSMLLSNLNQEIVDTWLFDDYSHSWEFEMYSGYGDGNFSAIYWL